MQCNVGKVDKTARLFVGLAILIVGLATQSWWGAIGLIPLITGLVRWCPIYMFLGVSSDVQ